MRLSHTFLLIFCFFVSVISFAEIPEDPKNFPKPVDTKNVPRIVNTPIQNASEIKGFASEAIMAAFSYDFVNFKKQMAEASKYFTPDAWKSFKKNFLDDSNLLNRMVEGRFITTGAACGMGPLIQNQGIFRETQTYAWMVEFPVTITYSGVKTSSKVEKDIQMLIIQTDGNEGVRKLAVKKIILKPSETE